MLEEESNLKWLGQRSDRISAPSTHTRSKTKSHKEKPEDVLSTRRENTEAEESDIR